LLTLRQPYLVGNTNNEQGYYVLPALAAGINATAAESADFLLSSFTCPSGFEASNRQAYGVPVWRFRYFGDWPNLRLYNGSGAYHGSDLEMVFGNDRQVSGIPPSAAEEQTTALMQHAWAVFAEDPMKGLSRLGWPRYDGENATLIELAYNNSPAVRFVKPEVYDAPCSTLALGATETGTD